MMIDVQQRMTDIKKEAEEIKQKTISQKSIKSETVQKNYSLRRDYNNGDNIDIEQSSGNICRDSLPLVSEGFSNCQALLLKNNTTGEIGLFHIDGHGRRTSVQVNVLLQIDEHFDYMDQKAFTDNIDAFVLHGKSESPSVLYECCKRRKYNTKIMSILPGIDNRRGVIYDPRTNNIIVYTREKGHNKLTYYKGFESHEQDKLIDNLQKTLHENISK